MTTRNQHYVWRHYLEAWQDQNGLVFCSRNRGKPFATTPVNLMKERDFYKLSRITRADVAFIRAFTEPSMLRESHRKFASEMARFPTANDLIQNSDRATPEEKRFALSTVTEMEEKLHGQIEQHALPILEELRQKRAEFIKVDETAIAFFRYIAHQYFRTKGKREAIGEVLSQGPDGRDYRHLQNIVCHLVAENLGSSLFLDRNEFSIAFFEVTGSSGFITGDQPVVNIMDAGDGSEPEELALYYPLSPRLACMVAPREFGLRSAYIPGEAVDELNSLIACESKHFLVAASDVLLQHIVTEPVLLRPQSRRILGSLVGSEARRLG